MASSANVVKVDLVRALPSRGVERIRSAACLRASPALTAPERHPPALDLDHAQVSVLDTDPSFAHALVSLLQAEGFSTRALTSEGELMEEAAPGIGGCVIADGTRQDPSALELQRALTGRQWPRPVIFLTTPGDTKSVVRFMKAGAINCLPKPVERQALIEAVREALAESRAVSAQRAAQLRVRQMLERLTPREREVLDLALDGLLVKQIAARLGTAEKTIKTHKGRLMRKMEVRSTLGLVQLMITTGIPLRPPISEPVQGI